PIIHRRPMSAGATTEVPAIAAASMETKFRRGLWVATALSALALLSYLGTSLWAQNSLSGPESVVAAQSMMLAHDGTLYYDLNRYPYTVCAYMPIFYLLEAGLIKLGIAALIAGRLVSFAALLGLIAICRSLVLLYTGNRNAAWVAAILVASSSLVGSWGSTGQVDTLAILFAATAFYQYSRYHLRGESTLLAAGVFSALAVFTKQTAVAAPAAILILLFLRDRKRAFLFGGLWGASVLTAALAINFALHGHFVANTVLANANPFSGEKFLTQVRYAGSVCGGLLVVVAASFTKLVRGRGLAPCVYLGLAAAAFLATAAKIGSDTNYQIEFAVLLAVCAAIGLHEADFFPLYFGGSKSWITLLLLPVAVNVAVGLRVTAGTTLWRVAGDKLTQSQMAELKPLVAAKGGLVLSTDYNAMTLLRGRLDVEPLIYQLLVGAKLVDPEPIRRDLARAAFSTVILSEDVFQKQHYDNPEIATLVPEQLEEVRKHYRLVKHIPGPYLDGIYVYKPSSDAN
ncbi:MAG TPA: glycosyltransferase family 39 protein, partial [Bryobacteraceae bacterium]